MWSTGQHGSVFAQAQSSKPHPNETCPQEKVNDLKHLDGQREVIDFQQGLDLPVFDEAAQLGDREALIVPVLLWQVP